MADIQNNNSDTLITGTDSADSILSNGNNVTIAGKGGSDSINIKSSSKVSIDAGNDNDRVVVDGNVFGFEYITLSSGVTINGGAGDDNILNARGSGILINGGAGNDSLTSHGISNIMQHEGHNVSLIGGTGNDTLYNSGNTILLKGDAGDDVIENYSGVSNMKGNNVTIYGGAGNDSIYNDGVNTTINGGTGDDFIKTDYVNLIQYAEGEGNDTIQLNYNTTSLDLLIELTKGTLNETSMTDDGDIILPIGENNITIKNGKGNRISLKSPAGEITVINEGRVSIENSTNDTIINALDGNNYYVYNQIGSNVGIFTGAGSDGIQNSGSSVSIDSGGGNDVISNGGSDVTINAGAGDDSINNSSTKTFIQYNIGDGNDTITGFDKENTLQILSGTVDKATSNATDIFLSVGENTITLENSASLEKLNVVDKNGDLIPLELEILGTEADDSINNYYIDGVMFKGFGGNDTLYNGGSDATIDGGEGDDSIINPKDNVSINGGAGDDSISTGGDNVTINGADGNDYISNSGMSVAINGGEGNDTIDNKKHYDTISGDAGDDYIINSGAGILFNYSSGDGFDTIQGFKKSSTLNISGGSYSTQASGDDIIVKVGDGSITLLDAPSVENLNIIGEIDNTADNSITGGKGKDNFVYNGGSVTISGYDKKDKISTGELAYTDYAISGKDLIFNFGEDNSLTIQNAASKLINLNSNANYYTADGVLDKRKKSIALLATVESFTADSNLATIDGSATGASELVGNKKKNYIIAGANGSTLNGGKGNDTLQGGDGADLFIYDNKSGKDVIANFSAGDSISLNGVEIKDAKTKRGDTVLKFKGGALTVNDTTEFKIGDTLYSGGVFVADDTAKVYGSFKGAINLADYGVKNFDASQGKKKLTITGTDSANSLQGGKKNDTLWGGAGDDTFIFQAGGGKDLIADYAAGDMLQILDKKGGAGTFTKATFKDDTLTFSVKGGGKVLVSGVGSDTSINVNNTTQTVSDWTK